MDYNNPAQMGRENENLGDPLFSALSNRARDGMNSWDRLAMNREASLIGQQMLRDSQRKGELYNEQARLNNLSGQAKEQTNQYLSDSQKAVLENENFTRLNPGNIQYALAEQEGKLDPYNLAYMKQSILDKSKAAADTARAESIKARGVNPATYGLEGYPDTMTQEQAIAARNYNAGLASKEAIKGMAANKDPALTANTRWYLETVLKVRPEDATTDQLQKAVNFASSQAPAKLDETKAKNDTSAVLDHEKAFLTSMKGKSADIQSQYWKPGDEPLAPGIIQTLKNFDDERVKLGGNRQYERTYSSVTPTQQAPAYTPIANKLVQQQQQLPNVPQNATVPKEHAVAIESQLRGLTRQQTDAFGAGKASITINGVKYKFIDGAIRRAN
jgi:hypothetical protein